MKLATVVILIVSLLSFGCGGGGSSSGGNNGGGGGTTVTLSSLTISPTSKSIVVGTDQQFTATGKYSDGSSKSVTSSVQWTSSDTSVATISAGGMATTLKAGQTTISAKSGTVSVTAVLDVSAAQAGPTLSSITIAPSPVTVPVNTTQQLSATGKYSDGSSRDLTAQVTWMSSASSFATVSAKGVVTGVAAGSANVTATLGSVNKSVAVVVSAPTISYITVTPENLTLGIGINQQYTATATYTDGSSADLTEGVTWTSSDTSVATVDNAGVANTAAAGSTTITATVGALTDSVTLSVVAAHLTSITVTPATASIAQGTDQQFVATGDFDDGSTQQLTSVTWSSASPSVATVDSTGLASGVGPGTTNITATVGAVSGNASLTVTGATLVSIAVTPANSSMAVGTSKQFTATGTFSDSTQQDITAAVAWSSSNPAAATINSTGAATAVATGNTQITAISGSISGSTGLTVSTAHLVSIAITPSNPTIAKRTSIQLRAVGTFSDGSTGSNLSGLVWKSSKNNIVSVRTNGVAHGKKSGSATISATASGVTGTTTLTVSSGTLVSISIKPLAPSVSIGQTQQFIATGTFSDATTQDLTTLAHWSSSSASVATIANAPSTPGLATAKGAGATSVGATSGSVSATTSATLTVTP